MLLRQFPLKKTIHNLCYNIKNFKPTNCRPTFKSQNHAFCTNSQLLEASCTNWIKQISTELPSRIFARIDQNKSHSSQESSGPGFEIKKARNIINLHSDNYTAVDIPEENISNGSRTNKSIIQELITLSKFGEIRKLEETIRHHKESIGFNLTPELLNLLFKQAMLDIPHLPIRPFSNELETPLHIYNRKLLTNPRYYEYLKNRVPLLYRIFKQNEDQMIVDQEFQENYIWLCYHVDDVQTLQKLTHFYLNNKILHPNALCYIMGGYILNYEVEFAKSLFLSLLGQGKSYDPVFLEGVVREFIKADALLENITALLKSWKDCNRCERPNPQTMSLILGEYYKYATAEEIGCLKQYLGSIGYLRHPLIRLTELKYKIIGRQPNSIKKQIQKEDLIELNGILDDITDKGLLQCVHMYFIRFFAKYSCMEMIEILIRRMRENDVSINEEVHELLGNYFVSHHKFFQLMTYLRAISGDVSFSEIYLKFIYEGFIQTYPQYANEFTTTLRGWILHANIFSQFEKDRYLSLLKCKKLESNLAPYGIQSSYLDSKKYDSGNWKLIEWKKDKRGKIIDVRDQVNFRVSKGFEEVLRKGVKPDFRVMESTFRRLNFSNRRKIFLLVNAIGIPSYRYEKLIILDLQSEGSKLKLRKFCAGRLDQLNCNNRILLSRVLINKGLYLEGERLLKDIDPIELNDRSLAVILNLQLRAAFSTGKYDEMISIIKKFPIDLAHLSFYIRDQCYFIEKKLAQRRNIKLGQEVHVHDSSDVDRINKGSESNNLDGKESLRRSQGSDIITSIDQTLQEIRGLIGDIELRINKDKLNLEQEIKKLLSFLLNWTRNEHDDRYI